MMKKYKTQTNILIAFLLNISFSIFEIIGGFITHSIAIMSDAIHDFGDALSIGISYVLERKSHNKPNNKYTYGYARYSILGAFITTSILTIGSCFVIYESVKRIINPVKVNYNGMIIFAIVGVIINFAAAYFTKEGDSINQRSVNLHMLEDVLGWIVVLIGSILMNFTDVRIIDPIMSLGVALFILIHSFRNFKTILDLFLEKVPHGIEVEDIKNHLCEIPFVDEVHHIHIWSIDGENNFATMHVKTISKDIKQIKKKIREELLEHNINHVTIEIEDDKDHCDEEKCELKAITHHHHHH